MLACAKPYDDSSRTHFISKRGNLSGSAIFCGSNFPNRFDPIMLIKELYIFALTLVPN
jgi:hypothetical protein